MSYERHCDLTARTGKPHFHVGHDRHGKPVWWCHLPPSWAGGLRPDAWPTFSPPEVATAT
jgi:hypothetical protein